MAFINKFMNSEIQQYKSYFISFFLLITVCLQAQIPDGYYKTAEGKNKAGLKTALYNIIKEHHQLEYSSLSTYFRTSDWHPATAGYPSGYFWDMYSNNKRTEWYGMNREHSLPKSWFGIASGQENSAPIGSDLHNLYPSDQDANSHKSNYSLGEVDVNDASAFSNGVVKVGKNALTFIETSTHNKLTYGGIVFEPADEYKGDFARDYMYMVTCYENATWQSTGTTSMLIGGTYPVFNAWGDSLILKWHRHDPVSTKEINRNNAVYSLQKNRNPFIDHPELVEFIWGKYRDEVWIENAPLPEEQIAFQIKSNPVKDILTVKLNKPSQSTYFIKTLDGIALKTGKFTVDGTALTEGTVIVSSLKNGMYLLEVYSGTKKRYVAKFLVYH